jgi:hypothetical protein
MRKRPRAQGDGDMTVQRGSCVDYKLEKLSIPNKETKDTGANLDPEQIISCLGESATLG